MKAYDILHLLRLSTDEYIPVVQHMVHAWGALTADIRYLDCIENTRTLATFAKELSETSADIRNGKG